MPVWFCTNVGGGVFGEGQTAAWRSLGIDARLHHSVNVNTYWESKTALFARLKLRWDMYASYPLKLRSEVLSAKPSDIFVAVTNPFFLPALAARSGKRSGARIIQLVYDLYPDALIFGGGWTEGNPLAQFAAKTTRLAVEECAATVYLGERIRRYAEGRYGVAPRTEVIAVGADAAIFHGYEPEIRKTKAIRCLYSGHMGRLHDWRTLGDALSGGIPDGTIIEIASDGQGTLELKRRLSAISAQNPAQLLIGGTRGNAEWKTAMLAADIALVTMRKGAEKVVMPSKAYSAMAAGQAILAVCPRESDLADLISLHKCGWTVEPGDAAGLLSKLQGLPAIKDEILEKRRNAWRAAQDCYSMEVTGRQWLRLFETLDER
jgi:hypothetical protein